MVAVMLNAERKDGNMVSDAATSRGANRIGWLSICVFILFWVAPVGLVIASPPRGTPTRGEMALIGVFEVIIFIAAVGLLGTVVSTALAIWSLRLMRRSVVGWIALGLDIAAFIAVPILYFGLR